MIGQINSLLKTVKNVEDEAARGVHSLERTIDNIENDLKVCLFLFILIDLNCRSTSLTNLHKQI